MQQKRNAVKKHKWEKGKSEIELNRKNQKRLKA